VARKATFGQVSAKQTNPENRGKKRKKIEGKGKTSFAGRWRRLAHILSTYPESEYRGGRSNNEDRWSGKVEECCDGGHGDLSPEKKIDEIAGRKMGVKEDLPKAPDFLDRGGGEEALNPALAVN